MSRERGCRCFARRGGAFVFRQGQSGNGERGGRQDAPRFVDVRPGIRDGLLALGAVGNSLSLGCTPATTIRKRRLPRKRSRHSGASPLATSSVGRPVALVGKARNCPRGLRLHQVSFLSLPQALTHRTACRPLNGLPAPFAPRVFTRKPWWLPCCPFPCGDRSGFSAMRVGAPSRATKKGDLS
jgi:hypothetical protein